MPKQRIVRVKDLAEGQTVKFHFRRAGKDREGFVARHQGQWVAFENLCQHQPLPLDFGDNRFFTADGRHFQCQMHGALYEPGTGVCLRGPCAGARLKSLAIVVVRGWVCLQPE